MPQLSQAGHFDPDRAMAPYAQPAWPRTTQTRQGRLRPRQEERPLLPPPGPPSTPRQFILTGSVGTLAPWRMTSHHRRNLQGGEPVRRCSDQRRVGLERGAHPRGGRGPSAGDVGPLAGLAGLVGGAFSMAAGEYVSMRAQSELMQRELRVERRPSRQEPEDEQRSLPPSTSGGARSRVAAELADKMMPIPKPPSRPTPERSWASILTVGQSACRPPPRRS